jgi:hypothetical protein
VAPPPERTSPLALVRPQPRSTATSPNGFGLTAATDLRLQLTPITEISAVVPGQTWCQSKREAVRNPSQSCTSLTTATCALSGPRG